MSKTVVNEMVDSLARDIFRGRFEPGTRLPPYRRIADEFEVTLPTAQRAVGRVEELGLVKVRHGSGATVLDPMTHAHAGVLPHWVAAVLDTPKVAGAIVRDFLAVRRELAPMMLTSIPRSDEMLGPIEDAVEALERVVASDGDVAALMEADLAVVGAMLGAASSVALATVFNSFAALLEEVPQLQEAMYANPALNVAGYRGALQMLRSGVAEREFASGVKTTLEALDRSAVESFVSALEER